MTTLAGRLRDIEAIVGESNLLTATDAVAQYRVDGQQPVGVAFPGSPDELGAVLRSASESGFSVLLRGAGRHTYLGAPPEAVGLVISLARLDQIVEHDAENLTLTAQAGATLAALRRIAAERGQMLPLDPPGGEDATIGGVVAMNLAGGLRMGFGGVRDLVLGLRVAFADGVLVKSGGKTVKNVAGYELTRLFVGSFGTLGAIYEVTLRLVPAPEAQAVFAAALPEDQAWSFAAALLGSRLNPTTLEVCDQAAIRRLRLSLPLTVTPETRVVFAGFLGDKAGLARQEAEVRKMIGTGCARLDDADAAAVWQGLREAPYPLGESDVILRATVPSARAREIAGVVGRIGNDGWQVTRVGDGVVYAGCGGIDSPDRLIEVRSAAHRLGGSMRLEAAPLAVKRVLPVWDETGNLDLMRRLKESFDPKRTLGCGRYLPGL